MDRDTTIFFWLAGIVVLLLIALVFLFRFTLHWTWLWSLAPIWVPIVALIVCVVLFVRWFVTEAWR